MSVGHIFSKTPQKVNNWPQRGLVKYPSTIAKKMFFFPEKRKNSKNFEVSMTCIVVRCLDWKGDNFKVGLSTLVPIY